MENGKQTDDHKDYPVPEERRSRSLIEATAGIARPKEPSQVTDWEEVEQIIKEEVGQRFYQEMNQR